MSQPQTMSHLVHARFRQEFGPPNRTLGRDDHWNFQSSPDALPINVLLNGTLEDASVWIFDSNDPGHGVEAISIIHERQIDALIVKIQERVKRAAQSR